MMQATQQNVDDEIQKATARETMAYHGAESLDAAQGSWKQGIKSAEKLEYQTA